MQKVTFYEKHGVDESLFKSGIAAVEIKSPYPGGEGVYYARSVCGGFDLYNGDSTLIAHVRNNTGTAARIVATIYDGIEG